MDRRWIYGGLLIGAGVGVARIVSHHPKLHENTRLLLIGDSLAQGLSPHLRELATEHAIPYLGAGVSGSRIDQWLASRWLDESLAELAPTLVLVVLGTNDAFGSLSPEQVGGNLEALLSRFPEQAEVVWVGAPTLPETYGGRSPDPEVLDAIAERSPHYFPSHELAIPRGPDRLHPTVHGYAGWAGALWDWLS